MAHDMLVVEDDAVLQQMITMALGMDGIPFRTADDAAEALAQVRSEWPRMVLLDMNLPNGVDGWTLWDQMRQIAADRPLNVVVFSAAHNSVDRCAAAQRGALAVLVKNQPLAELLDQLRTAYRRSA
jgi:DNA-binding response OmpR family regulator